MRYILSILGWMNVLALVWLIIFNVVQIDMVTVLGMVFFVMFSIIATPQKEERNVSPMRIKNGNKQ